MQLLANENIPGATVRLLRQDGHDVISISESSPGISDEQVLQIAHQQQRIIVTFDSDYGELVYKRRLPVPAGVIYLRFLPQGAEQAAHIIAKLLANRLPLQGFFSTVTPEQVRQKPLPKAV